MRGEEDSSQRAQEPATTRTRPQGVGGAPARLRTRQSAERAPDVIVDFELAGDLLHVSIRNIGTGPAHRVRVGFDPSFRGAGDVSVPELALFQRLEFLAPGGTVRAFVDSAVAYFRREQPEVLVATVTFYDDGGHGFRRRIRHDLGIYRDLPRAHRSGG